MAESEESWSEEAAQNMSGLPGLGITIRISIIVTPLFSPTGGKGDAGLFTAA
jgi:hypothetical protein